MKKSNRKGFTLVELVVVIAIIGILAAILVPTMMNYVKKAKLKSANSNAKLIYTTANNCAADMIVDGKAVTSGAVGPKTISSMATGNEIEKEVNKALKDNGDSAGVGYFVVGTDGGIEYAQWGDGTDTTKAVMLGQYPDPATDPDSASNKAFGTHYSSTGTNKW